jgi:hypothetical protein
MSMDAYKTSIKLFAQHDGFEPGEFVPVFHRWIQNQLLADHLLIDVADYAHVPDGPGTLLITSEANLSTDRGGGRLGLIYFRKLPLEGTFADRLKKVMVQTLKVAAMLEAEPSLSGRLKFKTDEFLLRLNDRLLAPNNAQTFAEVKPDVLSLTGKMFGEPAGLEYKPSDLTLFEVHAKSKQSPAIKTLLERLG